MACSLLHFVGLSIVFTQLRGKSRVPAARMRMEAADFMLLFRLFLDGLGVIEFNISRTWTGSCIYIQANLKLL